MQMRRFNLGPVGEADCPVFDGMFDYCAVRGGITALLACVAFTKRVRTGAGPLPASEYLLRGPCKSFCLYRTPRMCMKALLVPCTALDSIKLISISVGLLAGSVVRACRLLLLLLCRSTAAGPSAGRR